jgi:hypothetical protein
MEDGLPVPWIVAMGGVAYLALYVADTAGLLGGPAAPSDTAARMIIATVFVVRDITFVQWCIVTTRRPLFAAGPGLVCFYVLVLPAGSAPFWSHGDAGEWLALPGNLLTIDPAVTGYAMRWTACR